MRDRVLHAIVCFVATLVGYSYMRIFCSHDPAFVASPLLPLGLGFGKEYGDSKASGNKWDWWDIVADIVGIIAGMAVVIVLGPRF